MLHSAAAQEEVESRVDSSIGGRLLEEDATMLIKVGGSQRGDIIAIEG